MTSIDELPKDVWLLILTRLPVSEVEKLRLVSRRWYHLTSGKIWRVIYQNRFTPQLTISGPATWREATWKLKWKKDKLPSYQSKLLWAARYGYLPLINKWITKATCSNEILLAAIEHNKQEVVSLLLAQGVSPDGPIQNNGGIPLIHAVGYGRVGMVIKLIDLWARDHRGSRGGHSRRRLRLPRKTAQPRQGAAVAEARGRRNPTSG